MTISRIIILCIALLPISTYSISLPLTINNWGKVQAFNWNGVTPLALDIKTGVYYELAIILLNKKAISLKKDIAKNIENENQYIFYLEDTSILNSINDFHLQIVNTQKSWPLNSSITKITKKTSPPKLSLIAASDSVEHGGAGLVVIESEKYNNLSTLAFLDENNIAFYPQTFQKDGFYTILFAWYTDHSTKWTNQYILAMDKAGNTNTLILSKVIPRSRKYKQSVINLPKDYAKQKAKELELSKEQSAKLEGNITEINKILAQQRTFERWNKTRTSFSKNAKKIIKTPLVFSKPALPMSNAITTATYGDQRKYFYQKKQVRTSVHRGLDYASYKNTPIYALLDGTIIYADWYSGNGKSVIIDHGLNTYSLYAHNSKILVTEGQKVKAGTQISISGTTGQSTGDHLHLSIFIQGMFVEPKEWITANSIDKIFHKPLKEASEYIKNITN